MNRRKNRRKPSNPPCVHRRPSIVEVLEARQLLTSNGPFGYLEIPLASNQTGSALIQDSNLQNGWDVALSPGGGPMLVADNATGEVSQFLGDVNGSPFRQGPSAITVADGAPTAITYNQTSDFTVGPASSAGPALFLIASDNGAIDGWNSQMGSAATQVAAVSGAEFTGLATANDGTNSFLYAADFHGDKIDVFNASFQATTLSANAFTDSALPAGYAPYNIQLIGTQLYVTYALQDAAKETATVGAGDGAIAIYKLDGTLVQTLVAPGGSLNAPYGMAMAPSTFGDFAGDLLVADSGDGHILAYNSSGTLQGTLSGGTNATTPLSIPGVRGLTFGNGAQSGAGDTGTLYYSAGSGGNGQLGEILNAFDQPLGVVPTTISATQGQSFSQTLAALDDSNTSFQAGNFIAQINWGDGNSTTGTAVSNGNGGFNIVGGHSYPTAGVRQITLTVSDGTKTLTKVAVAAIVDTSFTATPATLSTTQHQAFSGAVGTFTDVTGPGIAADYVASINWGDNTSSTGTISLSGNTFQVVGSHTYTGVGDFSVTATVSEVNSATATSAIGTIASTAVVADPNTLTATATSFDAKQGTATNVTVATFTDTYAAATADIFTATINWESGSSSTGTVTLGNDGVFTVTGSHAYVANGVMTVNVSIDDTPGTATASAQSTATVADGNTFTPVPMTVVANVGQSFSGEVATFPDANTLVRASDFTATIDWGDGQSSVGSVTAANGTLTVNGTHTYAAGGVSLPVDVTVTENSPGTVTSTATSTAVVPAGDVTGTGTTITSTAGATASSQVLATFSPDAGNTADAFTATVDWGDGSSFTTGTVTTTGDGTFTVLGSHTYSIPGNFTPDVIVFESTAGGASTPAVAIPGAAKVASPVVLTSDTISATQNTTTSFTVATFTDQNSGAVAGDFTATIDWGDGTSATAGVVTLNSGVFTVTGTHGFTENGTLSVKVTVTETSPATFSTTATSTANVADDNHFTSGTAALSATKSEAFSGALAVFVDSDTIAPSTDFSAVITWGDGTVTAGTVSGSNGRFTVSGSHTYAEDGSYPLSVSIEENNGLPGAAEDIATANAIVSPGSAFAATPTTFSATGGQTFSGTVATFTDTGSTNSSGAFTATINWGDGTTSSAGTVTGSNGNFTVTGKHAYAEVGNYSVSVQVSETAINDVVSATSTANVADGNTLTATGDTVAATAGKTFTGTLATFTDVNTLAASSDFTATVKWGDGTTGTGTITGSNGTFTISGSHAYAQSGSDTFSVVITEKSPGTVTTTATGLASVTTASSTATNTASISGEVFNDVNLNGTLDSGEPGLAGRIVFLNIDGSGKADGTNPQTTTDANGDFSFTNLAAGTYSVMEVVGGDTGVSLTTSPQSITLTNGQAATGINLGNALMSTIVPGPVSTNGPPASSTVDAAYINALYQAILGHAPDPTSLAYWEQQMSSGASNATIAQGIWDSPEHRGDEVEQFYEEFLGRASDPVGKAYWVAAYNSWGTEQIEVAGFLGSAEFQNDHSGDTSFVDALYQDIDLRAADSTGESYWVTQLSNGEAQLQVLFSFIFGQEASTAVVDSFYEQFLHRVPDSSAQMWISDLTSRSLTADQVAIDILSSSEFFNAVTGDQPPHVTSANSAAFTASAAGSFTVTTSGFPAGTITENGALPTGVTFTDNGDGTATLAGTPASTSAGAYPLTLSVSNGIGTAGSQSFVLTVSQGPAITSAASTTFSAGSAGTFQVTATGFPSSKLTETGALPSGVTFVDNGNGTATLSGTPAAGTGGAYTLAIKASNAAGPDFTQSFVLDVDQGPAITSASTASFNVGTAGSFTITTTGFPAATIATTTQLPAGLTLTNNPNGTATLSGTPAAGSAGSYTLALTAGNGIGTAATQSLVLTVKQAPAVISADSTTFATGTPGTFTVTTSGFPHAAITTTTTLPTGITLADNGDGTATLATTAAVAAGSYQFTISVSSSSGTATQSFTLTVANAQAPAFTSNGSTTFTTGTAGSFTITTTGAPSAAISTSSALPQGVTLTDNHDGTATLSGMPAANTGGVYSLVLSANNGVGTTVNQTLQLTVNQVPSITSAGSATFTAGTAGAFTVQTAGFPLASITETGTLPSGVTFVDNQNGTATLASTTTAAAGTYTFTINATNSAGSATPQTFTLTISS
ncbi:MAG TPA: TIGR03118 family protein [Pirellulales bacterium]|nr:TIGR03118 family protein [Pirellulales bacterium]